MVRLVIELVLDLEGDDRGIRVVRVADQPVELTRHIGIPVVDDLQVCRVVGPQPDRQFLEPVREAAEASLGVGPGPDPGDHVEPDVPSDLDETTEVAFPIPAATTAHGLVDVPDEVGRDQAEAARLHPAQFALPTLGTTSGEVIFPADGEPGCSAPPQGDGVDSDKTRHGDDAYS